MKWENFQTQMIKLCRFYQVNPSDVQETLREYYTSWLGKITDFELSEVVARCKERSLKPGNKFPQSYQLKELYDEIRKDYDYKEENEVYCEICDDTGYALLVNRQTGIESVCTCSCKKGQRINYQARNRKRKEDRTYILKLDEVDHLKFLAPSSHI